MINLQIGHIDNKMHKLTYSTKLNNFDNDIKSNWIFSL